MDRRNFLALIPSLSAIPFVGSAITKTDSGILLLDPEPEIIKPRPMEEHPQWHETEVRLYRKHKPGQCYDHFEKPLMVFDQNQALRIDMNASNSGMRYWTIKVEARAYEFPKFRI